MRWSGALAIGLLVPVAGCHSQRPGATNLNSAERGEPGPGMFGNPILPGTHPDPSVCRVGEDYYLVNSSFEYFPGVPLYHSRDLIHWELVTHVLSRPSQLDLAGVRSSQGIFAPTIRHHAGKFHVITSNVGGRGTFIATAVAPEGPWSDPIWIRHSEFTMDPSLLFDEDGRVYYTYHAGGAKGAIYQAEIDIETGRLLTDPQQIWAGSGGIWPEGPHLYKRGRSYYLLISEGGTSYDHRVTVARADSAWGTFEPAPNNPILSHGSLPQHPIQAAGHADLVDTPEGRWWAVLLGVRPATARRHHLGRETFLAPVAWRDEWPVFNHGEPIDLHMPSGGLPTPTPLPPPPVRDEFSSSVLDPRWVFVRNPVVENYTLRDGALRLQGTTVSLDDVGSPTAVFRQQAAFEFTLTTELALPLQTGQRAGLVLRSNERNHHELVLEGPGAGRDEGAHVVLRSTRHGARRELGRVRVRAPSVVLRIVGQRDQYEFYVELPGKRPRRVGRAPTRSLASEETESFTGVYWGLYAHHDPGTVPAPAEFRWVEMRER